MEKKFWFSPYRIYWIELIAIEGTIAKEDVKKTGVIEMYGEGLLHFPNKEAAQKFLNKLKKTPLKKEYVAYLITDRQFGLAKVDFEKKNIRIPKTVKQIEEGIIL